MNRHIFIVLFLLIGFTPAWGQLTLKQKLDKLVEEKLPSESEVGIMVYDLTDKKPLYSYRGDKLCRPASNMKILTVLTALSQPDADEPFRTNVWYKGTIENDTLFGDLYVVGGFDPRFNNLSMDVLVDEVARFPLVSIKGTVYGDVSMKDSLYWGSGWAWDDTPNSFQPYLSPLMFNKGFVKVTARPNAAGDPATLEVEPVSSFYTLTNETKSHTTSAGKVTLTRDWLQNGNNIVVKGNIEKTQEGEINVYRSQDFFMHTLVERLMQRGIEVNPGYAFAELIPDSTAVNIIRLEEPMPEVLNDIMKESDNMATEALLCKLTAYKTGKKRVSSEDGMDIMRELIQTIGHDPKKYSIADACGLSNYNSISPALLVDLLKYAYSNTEIFRKLYKAMPVSGIDGTLKNRMKNTKAYRNIHAKTGAVTGICTLSGYAKASNGHDIAFSIMNQNTLTGTKARAFEDQVCAILCE